MSMPTSPCPGRRPGMTLDGIGLFFQRGNTWYWESKALVDYIRRCQTELQKRHTRRRCGCVYGRRDTLTVRNPRPSCADAPRTFRSAACRKRAHPSRQRRPAPRGIARRRDPFGQYLLARRLEQCPRRLQIRLHRTRCTALAGLPAAAAVRHIRSSSCPVSMLPALKPRHCRLPSARASTACGAVG